MEHVIGEDLRSIISSGKKVPLDEALRWMNELLAGLHHSHESNVIHRDIKPANLMIGKDRRLQIVDFGLAKIEEYKTIAGYVLGTPQYMSPEQIRGDPDDPVDRRTDIYSAGVTLFNLLTSELPFSGDNQNVIMHKILTVSPAKPSDISPEVPHSLDLVVARALAKSRSDRFATAAEFSSALSGEETMREFRSKDGVADERTVTVVRPKPRRMWLKTLTVAFTLALLGGGSIWVWESQSVRLLTMPDGATYEGEVRDGKANGIGRIVIPGQGTYVGPFTDNKFNGSNAVRVFQNGMQYVGDYVDDNRQGHGSLRDSSGRPIYDGVWQANLYEGHGVYHNFGNGAAEEWAYDGEWHTGQRNGYGVLTNGDGTSYNGGWLNDKRDGQGVQKDANENIVYDGYFVDDLRHGRGRLTGPDWTYEGDFLSGHITGSGKSLCTNGNYYSGQWRDDLPDGSGVMVVKGVAYRTKMEKGRFSFPNSTSLSFQALCSS